MKYIFIFLLLLFKNNVMYAYTYSADVEESKAMFQEIELTESIYNLISDSPNNSFTVIDNNKIVQPIEVVPVKYIKNIIVDTKLVNFHTDKEKAYKLIEKTSLSKNNTKAIFIDNTNNKNIGSIKLNFAKSNMFIYKIRVSGSNDNLSWKYIPSTSKVYRLKKDKKNISNNLIELNVANNFKYISILLIDAEPISNLNIESISLNYFIRSPGYKYKTSLKNIFQQENNKSIVYFDLKKNINIYGFEFFLSKENYYLKGTLQAKTNLWWQDVKEVVVYRERFKGTTIEKNIIELAEKNNYKKWRIIFSEKLAEDLLFKMQISYLWSGGSIIFTAKGDNPYNLLFSDESKLKTIILTKKDDNIETVGISDISLISLDKTKHPNIDKGEVRVSLLKLTMLIIAFVLLLIVTFKLFLLYKKIAKENV